MEGRTYKGISYAYLILMFLFLYVPILVVVVYSFNSAKTGAAWQGFTTSWFFQLFQDTNVLDALKTSITVAFFSTLVAAIVGTIGAVGMYKYTFKGKGFIDLLLYIPIIIPEIIMGISLMAFFSKLNARFGIGTMVLSNATFCIPYVLIMVKARLAGFDKSIEDAARDLGANGFTVFRTIILPLIFPAVISGAMLSFALSLDDVIINSFVAGPESTTLPLKIFSMLKFGLSPEINALCSLMLLVTLIVLIVSQSINSDK